MKFIKRWRARRRAYAEWQAAFEDWKREFYGPRPGAIIKFDHDLTEEDVARLQERFKKPARGGVPLS